MNWQPIETAPISTFPGNYIRILVWAEDAGIAFGHAYKDFDGSVFAVAEGFNGAWTIPLWHPLPESPPKESEITPELVEQLADFLEDTLPQPPEPAGGGR